MSLVEYDYDSNEDESSEIDSEIVDIKNHDFHVSNEALPKAKFQDRNLLIDKEKNDLNRKENFKAFRKVVLSDNKAKKVLISVPSLKQFEVEPCENTKKESVVSEHKLSLFSMLPPPKYSTLVKRNEMFENQKINAVESKCSLNNEKMKAYEKKMALLNSLQKSLKSTDLEQDSKLDFFCLSTDSKEDMPIDEQIGNSIQEELKMKAALRKEREKMLFRLQDKLSVTDEDLINLHVKRKRIDENLTLIDIHGDDALTDTSELIKGLSEEQVVVSTAEVDGHSNISKKRHQITYLASLAKAREVELKNMWAEQRMNRQQSAFKYGF